MGFKAGEGLGKNGTGEVCPISVTRKRDRGGLGTTDREEEAQARREVDAKRRQCSSVELERQFVDSRAGEAASRRVLVDLGKAQRACEGLDEAKGLPRSPLWPDRPDETSQEPLSAASESYDPLQEFDGPDGAVPSVWPTLGTAQKLAHTLTYLRQQYSYCVYCAVRYEDRVDMDQFCPGAQFEDH
jgi:hypothetical protein